MTWRARDEGLKAPSAARRHRLRQPARRMAPLALAAISITLALASAAHADSGLQLSISMPPVRTGPEVTFTVAGTSVATADVANGVSNVLSYTIRPLSLGPCASSSEADGALTSSFDAPNDVLLSEDQPILGDAAAPFSYPVAMEFDTDADIGSWVFCAWLEDAGTGEPTVLAADQLQFTLSLPQLTLQLGAPTTAKVGVKKPFTASGSAAVAGWLKVEVVPDHYRVCPANGGACTRLVPIHGCAATPTAEAKLFQEDLPPQAFVAFSKQLTAGESFSLSRKLKAASPGKYFVCGWMGESDNEGTTTDKVEQATITVGRR